MNMACLDMGFEMQNRKARRFRWRLTSAQQMLCRNQNRRASDMTRLVINPSVSAQANLRKQVKSQRDGRSQNRRVARGLPI
jgi:hypothetical protein